MASPAADRVISDLVRRGELAAQEVLRRNRSALALLADEDRRRLETLVYTVASRLLDEPRSRLARLDDDDDAAWQLAAIRELFALDRESGGKAAAAGG